MAKAIQIMCKPPILAAFGNPLLDVCVLLTDEHVLKKYDLLSDGQKEINKEEEVAIFQDVRDRYVIQYCAGGAAQNSLRIFQWLIGSPHYSVFLGGIGNDEQGKLLEELVKSSGVDTRYTYHEDYPTATCLALINGENRSLAAHLGAANVYEPYHLDVAQNMEILSKVQLIYIEGFFVTHSFSTALKLVRFCRANEIALAFNLSGVYVCQKYSCEVLELVKHANIIFGNVSEFKMLNEALNLKCESTYDIAVTIKRTGNPFDNTQMADKKFPKLLNEGKVVVITQGKESVICAQGKYNTVNEFKVPVIDRTLVKDSTGAGDAFVAGFLAGVFVGQEAEVCVKWGCWTAQQIIQQIGCAVPEYPPVGLNSI